LQLKLDIFTCKIYRSCKRIIPSKDDVVHLDTLWRVRGKFIGQLDCNFNSCIICPPLRK